MKLIIDIKDSKAEFFMELISSFKFIKATPISDKKAEAIKGFKQAINDVKLHKQGKLKLKSADDLLNEL